MKPYTITITYKAQPGDRVTARNYRRGNKWEHGVVLEATAGLFSGRVSYRIRLDRSSKKGNPLFLYLGDDSVERL